MTVRVFGAETESEARAVRSLLRAVARAEKCRAAELSVVFVSSPEIRRLNQRFLKHNRFTDVMAFPVSEEMIGEIYVSRDQAALQAVEYGVSLREELLRLVLHGFLHLLGYSHSQMPPLELRYLTGKRHRL